MGDEHREARGRVGSRGAASGGGCSFTGRSRCQRNGAALRSAGLQERAGGGIALRNFYSELQKIYSFYTYFIAVDYYVLLIVPRSLHSSKAVLKS